MKISAPKIEFHIECYHYETVTHNEETTTERVVTHRASKPFRYTEWTD